jgi:hypothetical protein
MSASNEDGIYTVQISIQNSSDTDLRLYYAVLTYGSWSPCDGMPGIGTALPATHVLTYFNAASSAFAPVGGSITFTPANGGSVVVSWVRQSGEALSVNGSISSDTLTLQCSGINVSTQSPTAQYVITNIGN